MIASFSLVGLGDIDDISINPSDGLMYAAAGKHPDADPITHRNAPNHRSRDRCA